MQVRTAVILLAVAIGLGLGEPAVAETHVGIRGGVYTGESDAFVGAELLERIAHRLYFDPNLEYVFVDGLTFITLNGDIHYDLHTHSPAYVWIGAGPAILYKNPDGPAPSVTKAGANFFMGVGLRGPVIPYVQAKVIASSDSEFVLAFGLRF